MPCEGISCWLLQAKPVFNMADVRFKLGVEAVGNFLLSGVSFTCSNNIYNSDFVSTSASKFE